MKQVLVALVMALIITSCTSKTEVAAIKDKYTNILILNDSITAVSFDHLPAKQGDITVMTMQFTYNGETRSINTQNYKNAFAMPTDSARYDKQIGYFILKKDIR